MGYNNSIYLPSAIMKMRSWVGVKSSSALRMEILRAVIINWLTESCRREVSLKENGIHITDTFLEYN